MVHKTFATLAKAAGLKEAKYAKVTLGIWDDNGDKVLANPCREGAYLIALEDGIKDKTSAGEDHWDDYIRRCVNEVHRLQGIKPKIDTYLKNRHVAKHEDVYLSLDFFLQEALRRRRVKLRNPRTTQAGRHRKRIRTEEGMVFLDYPMKCFDD